MMMRFHWGLGVGHTYTYDSEVDVPTSNDVDQTADEADVCSTEAELESGGTKEGRDNFLDGMNDREKDDLGDSSEEDGSQADDLGKL